MHIDRADAQSIVDEMKAVIHQDINIMDESGRIIASTDPARVGEAHAGAIRILREGLPSLTVQQEDRKAGVRPGINLPVLWKGVVVGVIGITGEPEKVAMFGDVIRRMTEILLESSAQKDRAELEEQSRSIFLENWLFSQNAEAPELWERGELLGFRMHMPYTVALLHTDEAVSEGALQSGRILRFVHRRAETISGSYAAALRSRIVLLLCLQGGEEAQRFLEELAQAVQSFFSVRVWVGASSFLGAPRALRRCYDEATLALELAQRRSGGHVCFYRRANLELALESIPRQIRDELREAVFSRCSAQEREEFVQLIRLYFQEGGDLRACAEKRYQHRNTIQYHINALRRKTQYDLRMPRDSLTLYIAAMGE